MRPINVRCLLHVLLASLFFGGIQIIGSGVLASDRPNVVQIMADDLGWGAVGYQVVKTPRLDALARKGMVFRRAYAAPVCSPTRASLQVGFHAGHTWTDWNIRWP